MFLPPFTLIRYKHAGVGKAGAALLRLQRLQLWQSDSEQRLRNAVLSPLCVGPAQLLQSPRASRDSSRGWGESLRTAVLPPGLQRLYK